MSESHLRGNENNNSVVDRCYEREYRGILEEVFDWIQTDEQQMAIGLCQDLRTATYASDSSHMCRKTLHREEPCEKR
jgi:hypothetical protein